MLFYSVFPLKSRHFLRGVAHVYSAESGVPKDGNKLETEAREIQAALKKTDR